MRDKARILFLADEPDKGLWDYFEKEKLDGIDLIIACGDLPPLYLSFLVTYFHGPLLYIHGNHDGCYSTTPPEGCTCIEDKVYDFDGIRIAGLGGSMEYNKGPYQYTEKQMKKRVRKLRRRIRFHHGVDILVTHSPIAGLNDGSDLPHKGFECFKKILDKFHPTVMVHGHVHMNYNYAQPRIAEYGTTTVLNAYKKYIWDFDRTTTHHQSQ